MPKTQSPEPTDEMVAASAHVGMALYETIWCTTRGYDLTEPEKYDSGGIVYALWVELTCHLAGVNGWTAEELGTDLANHVGRVRAN